VAFITNKINNSTPVDRALCSRCLKKSRAIGFPASMAGRGVLTNSISLIHDGNAHSPAHYRQKKLDIAF